MGPIADRELQHRVGPGARALDVADRDRPADGRAEAAARDLADGSAILVLDPGALARRRAAVGADSDQPAGGSVLELLEDHRGARKTALGATPLRDRPAELGLD